MSIDSSSYTTPSGMTGAGGGNLLRITGMATGLDVDAIVKKMMAAEQTKLDKAKQQQQTIQWKQDAYQSIIKEIKDLQSSFFDSASSDNNILSSSNFSPFTVLGTSGPPTATFTPGVGAQIGTYSIVVNQLATAATKTGTPINVSNTVTSSNWDGKQISFSINGGSAQTITLSNPVVPATAEGVASDINNQISNPSSGLSGKIKAVATTDGKIQFLALTDSSVKITSTNVGNSELNNLVGKVINPNASSTISDLGVISDSHLKFKYNGSTTDTDITIKSTDKISDVINNISKATSGAVTASFSQLTGKLTIQTASTGSNQSVQITTAEAAAAALGITSDATANSGTDANVTITPPGANIGTTVSKSTNNFTIDGMSYSLSGESTTAAVATIGADSQKVFDKIKSFIDKYNTIVDEIQTKLTEKPDSNYKPLTDAQKSSMSESQITAWETKAKVGILRNDSNLQNLLDGLRTAFTTPVSSAPGLSIGSYGTNSFGIDTSIDYSKPAHVDIVDISKLKAAISSNSDGILKLFTNVSNATDGSTTYDSSKTQYQEEGIFTRINKILQANVGFTNTTLNSAILTSYANKQYDYSSIGGSGKNTLPDQLYEQQLMIKKITDEMSTKQEAYYQQFSQLETAMNQLNAQQSMLSSMISG